MAKGGGPQTLREQCLQENHRSLSSALISKSDTSKKILDILLLGNKEAVRGRRNLSLKEVAKKTNIRHKELTMMSLHKYSVVRVVANDDWHIEQVFDHEFNGGQNVKDHEQLPNDQPRDQP